MSTRATLRTSLQVAGAIALSGGALLQTVSAQDDLYSIVDLGTVFSEQISLARSVNVHGQVAGRTGAVNGSDTRAAVWSLGGLEILGVSVMAVGRER